MTAPILPRQAVRLPDGQPSASPAGADSKHGVSGEFDVLLQALRANPNSEAPESALADPDGKLDAPQSAKVFNSDGFFDAIAAMPTVSLAIAMPTIGCPLPDRGDPHPVAKPEKAAQPIDLPVEAFGVSKVAIRQALLEMKPVGIHAHRPSQPALARLKLIGLSALAKFEQPRPDLAIKPTEAAGQRAQSSGRSEPPPLEFRLTLEGQTINIVGRIEELSSEEEDRLIDTIAALLSEHGLSLHHVTINGRSLALPNPRS